MRPAPVGAVVGLSPYDWNDDGPGPDEGDYILTTGGTAYRILEAHRVRSTVHPNRYRLRALKLGGADEIPEGVRVLSLRFYRRDRKRPR